VCDVVCASRGSPRAGTARAPPATPLARAMGPAGWGRYWFPFSYRTDRLHVWLTGGVFDVRACACVG
jgi:hypothetical protein